MAPSRKGIYFDQKDIDILQLVNRVLDGRGPAAGNVFDPNLHPHGIKELVDSPAVRMAYAVASLLRKLETGGTQARERVLGLRILYDEVLSSAHSSFRFNTARVLMQIMKSMVRAHGQFDRQVRLAHDFRAAAHGTPRVVRRLLRRYFLPELSEEWNQLAFDDHVYDMNTKGRKTPTHLIMDAWIKGLRTLTVVYDNCVAIEAVEEALSAASIVGIDLRIGLEYKVHFRGDYVSLLWIPRGFSSNQAFLDFIQSPEMTELSARGRDVVAWDRERVLECLEVWNHSVRSECEARYGIEVPSVPEDDFLNFVGRGHPNKSRLADYIYRTVAPSVAKGVAHLAAKESKSEIEDRNLADLRAVSVDVVENEWLNASVHPEIPCMSPSCAGEDLPMLLKLDACGLSRRLVSINVGYRLILCTTGLSVEDVIEMLWDCEGRITHLEIFNMCGWMEGRMPYIQEIGELQHALNYGQGPRVKQLIRQVIRDLETKGDVERARKFAHILANVPMLWEHYRHEPLKSRIGTGSTSRYGTFGMGLVVKDTLPARGLRMLSQYAGGKAPSIPVEAPMVEHLLRREPEKHDRWRSFLRCLRFLPGCSHLGMVKSHEWTVERDDLHASPVGNIANLGGLSGGDGAPVVHKERGGEVDAAPGLLYLNSTLMNVLKVTIGLLPACFSFQYTQSWWFLAWFGPLVWLGITGVRNVVQMVLAAKGVSRNTLIHWRDHVNINRLCDSLMYTGFSVFLLEFLTRATLLGRVLDFTVANHPYIVFTVLSVVNGLYIFTHNIFRGFPMTAAIGNLFRSIVAIPVATFYNGALWAGLSALGVADPAFYLVPSASIISKCASDTVAAVIEGFADSNQNMRIRRNDYRSKLQNIFDCYTRLELLFPKEDALTQLCRPGGLQGRGGEEAARLENGVIINALDLMFIWYCQPRAQDAFRQVVRTLSNADRTVLAISQLVLMREREVSQRIVDGLVGANFARPLSFFLSKRKDYVRDVVHLLRPGRKSGQTLSDASFTVRSASRYN